MKITIAIDSFKGSLSSLEAGNAVKEAALNVNKDAVVVVKSLADGGEGTVDALASGMTSETVEIAVTGPLMQPVTAKYCILKDTNTAVIEMASAAGITLVDPEKRNPMETTTYGVGELIKDAINKGCRRFIVGIGGSATNDGGIGMLMALGYRFLDDNGMPVSVCGKGLEYIKTIDSSGIIPELKDCLFRIACDVSNSLCGENGCSAIYGPQKGADPQMVLTMDGWLSNFAQVAKKFNPKADEKIPGAGAAGGLGFAFLAFTNAELKSGVEIVLEETALEKDIMDSDIVVTGEGRLDAQSVMGKAPVGVARMAKKHGKKVIAFCGCVGDNAEICNEHGIDAFFPILRKISTLDEAMDNTNAYKNLKETAMQVFRLL